ncbi:MAG: rhomboid family intramembrane serine protease [Lachnospiraceae bacterium]|nr:rhomboid family intramembrane serine protease [Lachnospiraceae bacterium]
MMREKRKIRVSYNSPVILNFVMVSLIVLIAGYISGGAITRTLFMTYRSSLLNPLTFIRLFTHVLGHSSWLHFIGNASYLLLLGPMLEEKYGSGMIIRIMAVTALATGIVNSIFSANTALCGASGVVFAFIVLASFTGFNSGEIPLTFILVAVIYIGQQLYEGLIVSDDISNTAHIVGGIVGAVIGYAFNKREAEDEIDII